jgi:hypothetical protein
MDITTLTTTVEALKADQAKVAAAMTKDMQDNHKEEYQALYEIYADMGGLIKRLSYFN